MVEKHVERIHSLESALRQRESSLHKLNTQLHNKDMQYLQLHSPDSHSKSCYGLYYNIMEMRKTFLPYTFVTVITVSH